MYLERDEVMIWIQVCHTPKKNDTLELCFVIRDVVPPHRCYISGLVCVCVDCGDGMGIVLYFFGNLILYFCLEGSGQAGRAQD